MKLWPIAKIIIWRLFVLSFVFCKNKILISFDKKNFIYSIQFYTLTKHSNDSVVAYAVYMIVKKYTSSCILRGGTG